jgi:hypothetical protein
MVCMMFIAHTISGFQQSFNMGWPDAYVKRALTVDTHFTAVTRFLEVNGDRFAYRRWGNPAKDQPPLFFLQHFLGGMDHRTRS